jgi:hypothetical protein
MLRIVHRTSEVDRRSRREAGRDCQSSGESVTGGSYYDGSTEVWVTCKGTSRETSWQHDRKDRDRHVLTNGGGQRFRFAKLLMARRGSFHFTRSQVSSLAFSTGRSTTRSLATNSKRRTTSAGAPGMMLPFRWWVTVPAFGSTS